MNNTDTTPNFDDFLFLRGERLIESMIQGYEEHIHACSECQTLEEADTYPGLERNIVWGFPQTKKRQHATDPIKITQIKIMPYQKSTKLLVEGTADSDGKLYSPRILFMNVSFRKNKDPDSVTFTASDGQMYNVLPINIKTNDVKVRCNCLDFFYRFALWNYNNGSIYGRKPPLYRRKTTTYPPVNPLKVPGICKHLIKLVDAIQESGLLATL